MDTVESYYGTDASLVNVQRVDPKKEVCRFVFLNLLIFNNISGFINDQRAN